MFAKSNEAYSALFRAHGDSSSAVMIPKGNQDLRYASIGKLLPRSGSFTYLDYGVGLGHQYDYFLRSGWTRIAFTGVDVNGDFLAHCKEKFPQATFMTRQEFLVEPKQFEFVGVVGTFNLIYSSAEEQQALVFEEICNLWRSTRIALFLNFMSTAVDYRQVGAHHQDVGLLYNFVASTISRKIKIDSSYLPYEFTMAIFR